MSIVRVGLSETHRFADGYSAIFGKKARSTAKSRTVAKAKPKKKPAKK